MIGLMFIDWTKFPRILINTVIIDRGRSPRQPNWKTSSQVSHSGFDSGEKVINWIIVKIFKRNRTWMRSASWKVLKLPSNCRWKKHFHAQLWRKVLLNFFSCRGHESWSGIIKAFNPLVCCGWCLILDLVQLTPLMGHLRYLASHWSVPMGCRH